MIKEYGAAGEIKIDMERGSSLRNPARCYVAHHRSYMK
jgi:hypothetical protein